MTRKSCLFVVEGFESYGVLHVWDLLYSVLSTSGYSIAIVVLDRDYLGKWESRYPAASLVSPPFAWHRTVPSHGWFYYYCWILLHVLSQIRILYWLLSAIPTTGKTAIIFQSPIETLLCALVARRRCIPALWFVPNLISSDKFLDINRRLYRLIFKFSNLIPVSNSYFTDSTFGFGGFRRHVVHLGVDTERFVPSPRCNIIRSELQIPNSSIVIGVFARMIPSKGQRELIQAIAQLDIDLHAVLCGGPTDGDYFRDLVGITNSLGLCDRVHFAGFQANLQQYYACCDLIGNFRTDPEPFGLSVIEAMACAKPVLAHAAGGPAETIVNGETGWLLSSLSVDSITDGLICALRDRDRWAEMGRAARSRAVTMFSYMSFKSAAFSIIDAEIDRSYKRATPHS